MMDTVLFQKRRDAERRMNALAEEIAEMDKEIASGFGAAPDLGSARVGMLPVIDGQDTRWATTNLREVVARDVAVAHLTRMDEKSAWLGLSLGDKGRVGIQLVARLKPIRLEIMPTERADVRYT